MPARPIRLALLATGLAFAAPTYAQDEAAPRDPTEIETQQPGAAPAASMPLAADADLAADTENILYLDLSTGERVAIRLMPDWAAGHVARIKQLTRAGFYDGIVFHRVIDGFMAQTGDPTGTGTGGSQMPDLAAEFNAMPHVRGTVAMARQADDEDSANSQFFIVFYPRMALDRRYTNFGRVIANMGAVDAIERGEPPASPTRILQASIAADGKPQAMPSALAVQPIEITADMLSNSPSE